MPGFLKVLRSMDPSLWPVGRAVPVPPGGLSLRGSRDALVEQPLEVSQASVRLFPDTQGVRAQPGGGGAPMHVNGVRGAEKPLEHGDVLGVERFVFRYQTGDWPGPHDLAREAALAANDDDGWAVYGDWLAERGSRHAELLRERVAVDEQARWLWPLAVELQDASVDLTFARGAISSLRVRDPMLLPFSLAEALALHPEARALEHLTWVELPWVKGADVDQRLETVLQGLMAVGSPRSLKTVHLGPAESSRPTTLARQLLRMKSVFPHLETTVETLTTPGPRPAEVRFVVVDEAGDDVLEGVTRARPLVLREGASVAFRRLSSGRVVVRRGPPQLREDAVRVSHGADGWRVLAPINRPGVELPRLFGRPLPFFRLAPGDLVELVPGLTLRFERR
jgi:uncharacterized protein (TIGR02996 family)